MLKEVGARSKTQNTIFIPHGPHALRALHADLQGSFMAGMSNGTNKQGGGVMTTSKGGIETKLQKVGSNKAMGGYELGL